MANVVKVLLVEDKPEQVNLNGFPIEASVTSVTNLADAVREIYGSRNGGYTDLDVKNPKGYEVLLTDMNFPIGEGKFGGYELSDLVSRGRDEPLPLGWPLVVMGAQAGIKKIGMLTDTNHHNGPMAATFDILHKNAMKLEDSLIYIWNSRVVLESEGKLFRACENDVKNYAALHNALVNPTQVKIHWSN